ncbi:HAD family hydrolase [Aurantiacibacter marinus]|uniref:HAD family hydrolase n=1 Tax=Aurantiacibacter marinus TaxID=874156 RepID=UPI000AE79DF6|nr:HAD family phosphatase [Aurantiacibacter marinus]
MTAVVFDVGRVLVQWDLRCLFAKLIGDPEELEWFVTHVVTEEWHHQHDEGRALADMVPERIAEFPDYAEHLHAYATRFNETIPGNVPGTHDLARRLHARGVPVFGLTNFGHEFWAMFRPTQPVFDLFTDIVVSGTEKLAKPDPAIYALAETRFALPPQQLFFIDDKPENIAAAAARGWQGHVFTDAMRLETDLARRGLL